MSNTKFGTFQELIELTNEDLRPIVIRLKELIINLHPEAVEVVRLGERAATFGLGPKKMSEGYAYVLPYKNWVNLGFYKGAVLQDPKGLLEGAGKNLRHIKIHSLSDIELPEIKALLLVAYEERKEALTHIMQ